MSEIIGIRARYNKLNELKEYNSFFEKKDVTVELIYNDGKNKKLSEEEWEANSYQLTNYDGFNYFTITALKDDANGLICELFIPSKKKRGRKSEQKCIPIQSRVPEEVKASLDALAKERQIKTNHLIREILCEYVEKNCRKEN